jgi:tight adherence protein B
MIVAMAMILAAVAPLGVLIALDAHRETCDSPSPRRHPASSRVSLGDGRTRAEMTVLAVSVALGVLAAAVVGSVSGWLGPAVVIAVIVAVGSRNLILAQQNRGSEIERVEALASWVENLRDVLSAGDQPMGAIASTVATCPGVIKPQVRRLAAGLTRQDPDLVLRRFADDLNDSIGDLVAAGLLIAIRQGARTVGVLSTLAEQARSHADRRRIIESERAPARREVQILTGIMGALVMALVGFGRSDYLRAYDTGSGQLFLVGALSGFGALILRVQRLARFNRPARFLTASALSAQRGEHATSGEPGWLR